MMLITINKFLQAFIILFFLLNSQLFAQKVENVRSQQKGDNIEISYDLTGAESWQKFNVIIYCSTDGGETYRSELKSVTGDVGKNITSGYNKKIIWNVLNDTTILQSNDVVFLINASTNKKRSSFYAGYKGSKYCPIGLQIGGLGDIGGYGGVNWNSNSEFTIFGGITTRIAKLNKEYYNMHLATGIGYGYWAYNYSIDMYELPAMGGSFLFEIGTIINFNIININVGYLIRSNIFNSDGVKLNNGVTYGLGYTF